VAAENAAYDPENRVKHMATVEALRTIDGRVQGYIWAGLTFCGLEPASTMRFDVDIGPDAFTYAECQECYG
jgi:hypothetical protein